MLQGKNMRPWYKVEQDFLENECHAVHDRQTKVLELEDDLISKLPIQCV